MLLLYSYVIVTGWSDGYIDILLLQIGWTALYRACIEGHLEVVKHLLNNNADISAADDVSDYVVRLLHS